MPETPSHQSVSSPHPAALLDNEELSALREPMLAFATAKLGDRSKAEDCVQDALLGALQSARNFRRQSTLKTWVFAILRNKIADALRLQQRFAEADAIVDGSEAAESFSGLFDDAGHWHDDTLPQPWATPDKTLESSELGTIVDQCVELLPAQHAEVFLMREVLELDTDSILKATGLSQSNLNVCLYRARMRLRECLSIRWFNAGEESTT